MEILPFCSKTNQTAVADIFVDRLYQLYNNLIWIEADPESNIKGPVTTLQLFCLVDLFSSISNGK